MLKETYLAILKRTKERDLMGEFIVVTATAHHILAPSWDLINGIKNGNIDWDIYKRKYIQQIQTNPLAMRELHRIKQLAKTKNVYLVCYEKTPPCHRFILMEMIEALKT